MAIVLFLSYNPLLPPLLLDAIGQTRFIATVQFIQFVNYIMLFFFCLYILRVVDVTRLSRQGWRIFGLSAGACTFLALYPVVPVVNVIWRSPTPGGAFIAIRLLDALLIAILTPVLWLYIQHLKSKQRQSPAFTLIVAGIIFSTLLDYLVELLTGLFPHLIPPGSPLWAAVPDVLFIYGYLVIAAGLYALHREDAWGYRAVDRAISGDLALLELDEDKRQNA
jgi:hypothetical protein